MKKKRFTYPILYFVLLLLTVASIILAFSIGAVRIDLSEIGKILFRGLDTENRGILLDIRAPRVLLAAVIGFGLACVGAVLQGVFQNPLVDSYTLGMSSGAALGAVLSIVLGLSFHIGGFSATGAFAFIGALLTLTLVFALTSTGGKRSMDSLLLAGVATSYFLASVISFLMLLNKDKIEHVVFWTMGSLSLASWDKASYACAIIIPSALVLIYYGRELNMLSLGDESAGHLGIQVRRTKTILLIFSALIVATVVSAGGTIAFVGLVAPHIIRILGCNDNKHLILLSGFFGSTLMVFSDLLGRTMIQPMEIPVGVMTSILGGPFFIYLLRKRKRNI